MLAVFKRASKYGHFFKDENFSVKDLGVRESWVGFGFINRLSGGFFFWVFIIEGQCWEAGGFRTGTRSAQRDKE